jgi:hypothetical protein
LIRPEKLLAFSGQKRWIFLPGIGSPGKVRHNRTLEAMGSTPIGSTKIFKGLDNVRPLETFPELPIVRIISLGDNRKDSIWIFAVLRICAKLSRRATAIMPPRLMRMVFTSLYHQSSLQSVRQIQVTDFRNGKIAIGRQGQFHHGQT